MKSVERDLPDAGIDTPLGCTPHRTDIVERNGSSYWTGEVGGRKYSSVVCKQRRTGRAPGKEGGERAAKQALPTGDGLHFNQ